MIEEKVLKPHLLTDLSAPRQLSGATNRRTQQNVHFNSNRLPFNVKYYHFFSWAIQPMPAYTNLPDISQLKKIKPNHLLNWKTICSFATSRLHTDHLRLHLNSIHGNFSYWTIRQIEVRFFEMGYNRLDDLVRHLYRDRTCECSRYRVNVDQASWLVYTNNKHHPVS